MFQCSPAHEFHIFFIFFDSKTRQFSSLCHNSLHYRYICINSILCRIIVCLNVIKLFIFLRIIIVAQHKWHSIEKQVKRVCCESLARVCVRAPVWQVYFPNKSYQAVVPSPKYLPLCFSVYTLMPLYTQSYLLKPAYLIGAFNLVVALNTLRDDDGGGGGGSAFFLACIGII